MNFGLFEFNHPIFALFVLFAVNFLIFDLFNPLHQNKLHVKALMQFLNLPEDHFHSVVLFIGNTEFKTDMPDNVLNGGLDRWIQNRSEPRIVSSTVDQAVSQLSELDRNTNRRSASREHLKGLKARHGSL